MGSEHTNLAREILYKAKLHHKPRFLVAIAGAPGSGKTTIAKAVQQHLNTLLDSSEAIPENAPVALVSMDGFHLPQARLDKLHNREEAYRRRGAPWTFDAEAFVDFVRLLRKWADREPDDTCETPVLYAPTFDHRTKDPVEDGTSICPGTSIILLEGNYLLYDKEPWREVATLVDLRVFIGVDLGVARERLARRHVEAGIEGTMKKSYARVNGNDYLNGEEVSAYLPEGFPEVPQSEIPSGRLLERNRQAASRCRRKRKEHMQMLVSRFKEQLEKHQQFQSEFRFLRLEILGLKNEVLKHADCRENQVSAYLQQMFQTTRVDCREEQERDIGDTSRLDHY